MIGRRRLNHSLIVVGLHAQWVRQRTSRWTEIDLVMPWLAKRMTWKWHVNDVVLILRYRCAVKHCFASLSPFFLLPLGTWLRRGSLWVGDVGRLLISAHRRSLYLILDVRNIFESHCKKCWIPMTKWIQYKGLKWSKYFTAFTSCFVLPFLCPTFLIESILCVVNLAIRPQILHLMG